MNIVNVVKSTNVNLADTNSTDVVKSTDMIFINTIKTSNVKLIYITHSINITT